MRPDYDRIGSAAIVWLVAILALASRMGAGDGG